ncbi:serine hydrolase domain-containing protein [Actimicrobium antarcticum]|uniref:Serine hydrolase domain-containing protein n=1 Tax=Actimicrobium antarcticum TaxID=1051899 RepID=A0ABP7SGD3_9BURK
MPADNDLQQPAFNDAALARIDRVIQSEITAGRIPGATLLVERGGKVGLDKAYGSLRPDGTVAMTTDAIFRIYSMTKPIVSVAIMMLAEQGRLLISEPVSHYLPELANLQVAQETVAADGSRTMQLVPCEREMTIQDLLRHTAGLTYGIFGAPTLVKSAYTASGIESRHVTNAKLIACLATLPLAFQPGTTWEYSRATDLLGALLERISGQTLDVYLEEQIFQPLQMHDTGFWVPPEQHHRIAEPFAIDPVTSQPVRLIDVRSRPDFLSGGGGLVSTARDYLRFARMMRNGGELEGVRLLSRKTVEFMTSDHLVGMDQASSAAMYLPGPGYGFGLGFAVRTATGAAYTPGSVGDFHWSGLAGTYFWIDPKEDLIAIWLMQAPEQRDRYRQLVRNLVHASLA